MRKKVVEFDIKDLLPIGLTLVVLGIGLSYGLNVLGDVKSDMVTDTPGCNASHVSACGSDYNASATSLDGVAKIPEKLPLITTVIVAVIIIGLLIRYLMVRF